MHSQSRALFVAIEGIDGSGKNTQVDALRRILRTRQIDVETVDLVDYNGPLGSALKFSLSNDDFDSAARQLLFSAERLRHRKELAAAILKHDLVLVDRYRSSAYVYGIARGLPRAWTYILEESLPEPDLTILLDLSAEASIIRTGGKDIIERNGAWLERCRAEYLRLAHASTTWKILDATRTQRTLTGEIAIIIQTLMRGQE